VTAIAQRVVLHQTITGSVGVGTYSFSVGSLHRFGTLRLAVSAASNNPTVTFRQQISSHATLWDVTSGGVTATSGAMQDYTVACDLGLFQIVATSATPLRVQVTGVPVG
jgi:hypothetical protein